MNDVLSEIVENKKKALEKNRRDVPLTALEDRIGSLPLPRGFGNAVAGNEGIRIIAEIKKASPSAGVMARHFDPVTVAGDYFLGGADALSVLTEEMFFHGRPEYIAAVKRQVPLPVLRKDFLFDPYQMYESRALGADAVLLIAVLLDGNQLAELLELGKTLQLDCLVEVHTGDELEKALKTHAKYIGINSRDLRDFSVDLRKAAALAGRVPSGRTVVAESGIRTAADIRMLKERGVSAFLVGETLMRSGDVRGTLRDLKGTVDGKS